MLLNLNKKYPKYIQIQVKCKFRYFCSAKLRCLIKYFYFYILGNAEVAAESENEAELVGEPASPASIHDQSDLPETTTDQDLSEDANYRETIRGVRSFMGWHHIPDYDNSAASMDDNPFAGSRVKRTGKVSVRLPVDEWLCRKMEKLNLTVAEGYPSSNSENSGLLRDLSL